MGKGSRLSRKASRKLKQACNGKTKPGIRKDDGRLSEARGARPRESKRPPPIVEARVRDLGLPEHEAARQEAGCGHGVLLLAGIISQDGYHLAERYRRLRHAYRVATLRPQTRDVGGEAVTFRGPREAASAALPAVPDEYQAGRQQQRNGGEVGSARTDVVETREEREERVRHEWVLVEAALAPRGAAARVLNDVVVSDVDIRGAERDVHWLMVALETLAGLWGVDPASVYPQIRVNLGNRGNAGC